MFVFKFSRSCSFSSVWGISGSDKRVVKEISILISNILSAGEFLWGKSGDLHLLWYASSTAPLVTEERQSQERQRYHAAIVDKEWRKLDAMGRKIYLSAALDLRIGKYQAII